MQKDRERKEVSEPKSSFNQGEREEENHFKKAKICMDKKAFILAK